MVCCTLGVGVCVVLYTECRCMFGIIHRVLVYLLFVQCVCVCVVQCDGIGRYGTIWALILDIDG